MVIEENLIDEVMEIIEDLAGFGLDGKNGLTRLLFDPNWIKAQVYLQDKFIEKGLRPYFDEVGNLYGRLDGTSDETILTGSHIDTVISGGKLDGQFGIVAGLAAISYLNKTFGPPRKNLEVVSMAEEEGSRFPFTFWGSKNIAGCIDPVEMEHIKDIQGRSFAEVMTEAGFGIKSAGQGRPDISAFIELHIEQGGVLERENIPIGIVEHIVGQMRYLITLEGEANHAGTTPMSYRKDALYGSARIIDRLIRKAIEYGEPLVATVGKMQVFPNTSNVVPAKVLFTLDIRHTDAQIMARYAQEVSRIVDDVAQDLAMTARIENYMNGKPVPMDKELVKRIRRQCELKGLHFKMMHSGAGHDAQIMAEKFPTALIFVPSQNGISHNPAEYTAPEHLEQGIKALIESLYALAYQ